MSISITPQERMDTAFDNYLALSVLLREDLLSLLEKESKSPQWRRNFIRVSATLIEGYAHCYREICAVSFESVAPDINSRETKVLHSERDFDANERIKLTLRAAHQLFDLQSAPNFGGPEWPRAKRVLEKRHLLMHPKVPSDLDIPDELWNELRADVTWLLEQMFNFVSTLQAKYGS